MLKWLDLEWIKRHSRIVGNAENGKVTADRSVNLQPHDAGTIERMAEMFPFVIRHAIVQGIKLNP